MAALIFSTWPSEAQALSVGRLRATPVLGQPLDVALPVALEEGEFFGPECAAVELLQGELKVHPDQVQVRVEPGPDSASRVVRIRTPFALFEPLVTVSYSLGCTARVQRQLVLFVDPPDGLAAPAMPAPAPAAALPEPRGDAASGGVIKRTGDLADRSPTAAASATLPRSPRFRQDTPDLRALRRPVRSVSAAPAQASLDGGAVTAPAAPQPAAPQPRLKLDAGTVATTAASTAAKAVASTAGTPANSTAASPSASSASAAASPAPVASQPLSLEQQLAALQQATQAQSETLARLQAQLESQADLQRTRQVLQALVGVMAVLVLLLGWKLWQVNPRRPPANAWMQPDESPPAGKA